MNCENRAPFFITICAASDSGGMENFMKKQIDGIVYDTEKAKRLTTIPVNNEGDVELYIVSAERYFTYKNYIIEPLNEYQAKAMVYMNIGVEGYLQLFKFLTDYEFEEIKAYIAESLENFNKEKEIFSESLIM